VWRRQIDGGPAILGRYDTRASLGPNRRAPARVPPLHGLAMIHHTPTRSDPGLPAARSRSARRWHGHQPRSLSCTGFSMSVRIRPFRHCNHEYELYGSRRHLQPPLRRYRRRRRGTRGARANAPHHLFTECPATRTRIRLAARRFQRAPAKRRPLRRLRAVGSSARDRVA